MSPATGLPALPVAGPGNMPAGAEGGTRSNVYHPVSRRVSHGVVHDGAVSRGGAQQRRRSWPVRHASLPHMADTDDLPRYRLLSGPDDASFCKRVSEMLEQGYELHGSPALTFDGKRVIAAQAVIRKGQ